MADQATAAIDPARKTAYVRSFMAMAVVVIGSGLFCMFRLMATMEARPRSPDQRLGYVYAMDMSGKYGCHIPGFTGGACVTYGTQLDTILNHSQLLCIPLLGVVLAILNHVLTRIYRQR